VTRKVTLTIPDELGERIDRHRDKLNQSAIFATAVEKELAKLEIPTIQDDLSATIARLRAERAKYEDEHYQLGLAAGTKWAKRADYVALRQVGIEDVPPVPAQIGLPAGMDYHHDAAKAFDVLLESLGPEYYTRYSSVVGGTIRLVPSKRFNAPRYWQGWYDGAKGVWSAVKDKV
jgi:hypothetical protein